ncbi:MAG: glycoside hydrolase family 3 C-terminal domain-containing protein [Spirochaetales bacterium]|nr:glycoside hydrolase family 3 C-terminal domain-containing protein [Spirochaetales bacterium]
MTDIKKIIKELSIEEKAVLCAGRKDWHFRGLPKYGLAELMACDGPHGLRKQDDDAVNPRASSLASTCFPTASALASSWNTDLMYRIGTILADECRAERVSVLLGPGVNIKRSPLCGRNFEYFSEDPLLSGELASALINGVQDAGVGCSLKHFTANNQESLRMTIDALIDERTLREIYLPAFETAVKKSSPWTIMCSYNRINGEYVSESRRLLTDILRTDWGWDGVLITDWGACNNRTEGLAAGQDIEMPDSGPENAAKIAEAVRTGSLPEEVLDRTVTRILNLLDKAAPIDSPKPVSLENHHLLAREAAAESIVLLKNENSVLPLTADDRIAVIGEFAVNPRYQGAGSSRVNPTALDIFLDEIRKHYPEAVYAAGYRLGSDSIQTSLIVEAVSAVENADKIIILTGLPDEHESEGFDRPDLKLPESHNRLIEALISTGKQLVICLSNGAPVQMPWNEGVHAVLECYLGGQAGAGALSDVLTGAICPSGKLAETFPLRLEDNPSSAWFPGGPRQVEYREGIYVGYRYYETAGVPVLYPFGHGLSYTSFVYSELRLSQKEIDVRGSSSDEELLNLSFDIENTGKCTGKEICQLYVGGPGKVVHRPDRELRGFIKLEIAPGERQKANLSLSLRSFSHWDSGSERWAVEPGKYRIMIGASANDIRLEADLSILSDYSSSSAKGSDYQRIGEDPGLIHRISDDCFEAAYGRELPANFPKKNIDRTTTLTEFSSTLTGKLLLKFALKNAEKQSHGNENSAGMYQAMVRDMPLRAVAGLSDRKISFEMVDALIDMGRGRLLRGLSRLIKAVTRRA